MFLGLGALGAALPLLPATPFVLLSAFCFSRSSPSWHERLRANETFGSVVRDWEERGAISPRAKTAAAAAMLAVAGWLWLFGAQPLPVKALATLLEAAVLTYIWSRPS